MNDVQIDIHKKIDDLEIALSQFAPGKSKVRHTFLHGMYIREITMPKDELIISMVHNTEHPFYVSKGIVEVRNALDDKPETIVAPYWGITKPGTRRVLFIIEETVWKTIHPLEFITGKENRLSKEEKCKLVAKIENMILDKSHTNFSVLDCNRKGGLQCHS